MQSSRRSRDTPACRWEWPMSRQSCLRSFCGSIRGCRIGRTATVLCSSAGHGSMLLYALLHLTGYADMTLDELEALPAARQPHRRASGAGTRSRDRDHDRAARAGDRQFGRHGARRADAGGRVRRRDRRSPHLRHRERRRPDGRGQPRGGLARRSSRPQQADRVLRRQFDFDRRPDRAVVLRRPAAALPGVWLGGRTDRRPRSRGHRRGYPAGTEQRSSEPHCLPHDDRLRSADQSRNRGGARRAARRRRDRRRAPAARVERAAFRDSRRHPRGLARGRRPRRTRAPRLGSAPRRPCGGAPCRVPAAPARRVAARPRSSDREGLR